MFREVIGKDKIEHFSLGDTVRQLDEVVRDKDKKKELISFLEKNYRGYLSLEEIISALEKRSTKSLLPSELILVLLLQASQTVFSFTRTTHRHPCPSNYHAEPWMGCDQLLRKLILPLQQEALLASHE